jgi:hypothetical protein
LRGVAAAGEQAVRLHAVEVVGERGVLDADGGGQLALVGRRPRLERAAAPATSDASRPRAASARRSPADVAGDACELHADRGLRGAGHRQTYPFDV